MAKKVTLHDIAIAANVADSMVAGVALARKAIESGAARQKLDQLIAVTRQLAA